MKPPRKRSITIRGHRTSFSVEDAFYEELEAAAEAKAIPLARLIAQIDAARPREVNLSSAIRLFVLDWVQSHKSD